MARPDVTVDFIPQDRRPAASAPAGESSAGGRRFEFLDPSRAPDELGWLAHYRVRGLLGEGGMGLVFEAEDTDLLRLVVLKVIRPELAGSPQAAQRFLLEARAMAALKHDHIVTIYQVGRRRGIPFLAMEYLRGMTLCRWLDRGHEPAVDLALRIGREIAAGLAAAHQRGLIHRDIKPANIWLEAPSGRVKILDFGLARAEGQDVQITNPGITVGSPAYMAPELARGERGDASCDLFSLGCVLYLLCTHRLPFPGTSVVAVLTSLATDTPPPPRETDPAIPAALDALVMRLLAKRPADRPASAKAVIEAIRSIERDLQAERQRAELSSATPPSVLADPARQVPDGVGGGPGAAAQARRLRRPLGIAVAAVLLGIVTISMTIRPRPHGLDAIVSGRRMPEVVATPRTSPATPRADAAPAPPAAVAPPGPAMPPAAAKPNTEEDPRAVAPDPDPPRPLPTPAMAPKPAMPAEAPRIEGLWGRSRIVDPDGDCHVVLERDRASILVPNIDHLLSAEIERINAPRVLREVTGDFEARVRVTGIGSPGSRASTTRYAPYHGAGILLWKDASNYVRLEIAADHRKAGKYSYVNFELRRDGHLATSWGLRIEDGASYLRLRRLGGEVRAAFSADGGHWTSFAPLSIDFPDRAEIGVAAVSSAVKPLEAHFDGFQLIHGPGAGSGVDADHSRMDVPAPPVEVVPAPVPAVEQARSDRGAAI